MQQFERLKRLVHDELYPGRENVVFIGNNQRPPPPTTVNAALPAPQHRQPPPPPPASSQDKKAAAAFVPRIGAFEVAVVLHTVGGRLGPTIISSKLTSGKWPRLERLGGSLNDAVQTLVAIAASPPPAAPAPSRPLVRTGMKEPIPLRLDGTKEPLRSTLPQRRSAPRLAASSSVPQLMPPPPSQQPLQPQPAAAAAKKPPAVGVPSADIGASSPPPHHRDLLGRASPPSETAPADIDWVPIAASAAATLATLPAMEVPAHHELTVRFEYCTAARPGRMCLPGSTLDFSACCEQLVGHVRQMLPAASIAINVAPTARMTHRPAPGLSGRPAVGLSGSKDSKEAPPLYEKISASLTVSSRSRSAAKLNAAPRSWAMHASSEVTKWTDPKAHRAPPSLPESGPTQWAPRVNAFEVSLALQGPSTHATYGPILVYSKLTTGQLPLRHDMLLGRIHRAAGELVALASKPGGSAFHEADGQRKGAGVARSSSASALLSSRPPAAALGLGGGPAVIVDMPSAWSSSQPASRSPPGKQL